MSEEQTVKFRRASFVRNLDLVGLDDATVFMDYRPPVIIPQPEDRVVYLENRQWPDEVSRQYLGDANLWWIIAAVNGIIDPMVELYPGRKITIPGARRIRALIQADGKIGLDGR